jgi:hypothetical protein
MYIRVPNPAALGAPSEAFLSDSPPTAALPNAAPSLADMAPALLCACNLTYEPEPRRSDPYYGTVLQNHYYRTAGFVDRPDFTTGAQPIDACLLGTVRAIGSTQHNVVLAFRGTMPEKPDWINNFEAQPVPFLRVPGALVHKGFNDSIESLFVRGLVTSIRARMNANPKARLYLTGHSKGGALAHLAARALKTNYPDLALGGVISFEAPRAGHASFAKAYNDNQIDGLRYEFQDDIVPHMPPTAPLIKVLDTVFAKNRELAQLLPFRLPLSAPAVAFEHVGRLRFVDWNGEIVGDSIGLVARRLAGLATLVPELAILLGRKGKEAAQARLAGLHAIACGRTAKETSGLWKAVCRTEKAG